MTRTQGLGMLVAAIALACIVGVNPAHAASLSTADVSAFPQVGSASTASAPSSASALPPVTPPVGSCITEDAGGISAALGPALFVSAPEAPASVTACTAALVQPLPRYASITSPFGLRVHPITGVTSMHWGTDYSRWGIAGTPILSIAAGTVVARAESYATSGAGNTILIAHDGLVRSQYMHMIAPSTLAVGDRVAVGQIIGYVGTTGGSTGPHLHIEVRVAGTLVDPARYLEGTPFLR